MLKKINVFYLNITYALFAIVISIYDVNLLPVYTAISSVLIFLYFLSYSENNSFFNSKISSFADLAFGVWSLVYLFSSILEVDPSDPFFKPFVTFIIFSFSLVAIFFFLTICFYIFSKNLHHNSLQLMLNLAITATVFFILLYSVFMPSNTYLAVVSDIFVYIFFYSYSFFIAAIMIFLYREKGIKEESLYKYLLLFSFVLFIIATLVLFRRKNFGITLFSLDHYLYAIFTFLYVFSVREMLLKDKQKKILAQQIRIPDKSFSIYFSTNFLLFTVLFILSTVLLVFKYVNMHTYNIMVGLSIFDLTINLIFSYGYFNDKIVEKEKEENLKLELYAIEQISDLKRINEELVVKVSNDSITGLLNISSLHEKIKELIQKARDDFSIISLNVDDFKTLNNVYGHHIGDQFLLEISKRLKEEFLEEDIFIYRIDGDEFAVLFLGTGFQEIEKVSSRLMHSMEEYFIIDDKKFTLDYSTSVVRYPLDAKTADEVIQGLNIAMIESKKLKNNKQTFFFSTMLIKNMKKKNQFEYYFRNLRFDKDFAIHIYQYADLQTGKITGIRPVLAWKQIRYPDFTESIEYYAEAFGFLDQVLLWFAHRLFKVLGREIQEGYDIEKISFRINNSTGAILKHIPAIKNRFNGLNLPLSKIDFEIDNNFLDDLHKNHGALIEELNNDQIGLVVKDFGIGFFSLNILKDCKVRRIMISEDIVTNIDLDTGDMVVFESLINIAKGLRIEILVEGIERLTQYIAVKNFECDYITGSYVSNPVEIETYFKGLREKHSS